MRKIFLLLAIIGSGFIVQAQNANKNALNQAINDSIRTNGLNKITAITLNALLHRLVNGMIDSLQAINTINGQKGLTNGIPTLSGGLVPLSQLPAFLDTAYATDDTTLTISIHNNFYNIHLRGKGGAGSTTDTTSLSARINSKIGIGDSAAMLQPYLRFTQGMKYIDTSGMLAAYLRSALGMKYADSAAMLAPYLRISGFTPTGIGLGNLVNQLQVINGGNATKITGGLYSARPAAGNLGSIYISKDSAKISYDNGAAWIDLGGGSGGGGGGIQDTTALVRKANNLSDLTSASAARINIGFGNVDNTSDATKNAAPATLTNKTIDGGSNTLQNIPKSAIPLLQAALDSNLRKKDTAAMLAAYFRTPGGATTQYVRGNGTLATTDTTMIPNFFAKVRSLISANGPLLFTGGVLSADTSAGKLATQTMLSGLVQSTDSRLAPTLTFTPNPTAIALAISNGTGSSIPLRTFINSGAMSPADAAQLDSLHRFSDSIRIFRKTGTDSVFLCLTPISSALEVCAFQYMDSAGTGSGSGGLTQLTGDGTAGPGTGSQVFTLATVNANVGTWGDGSHVPQFVVNSKGLITGVVNVAIAALTTNLGFTPGTSTGSLTSSNGSAATITGATELAAGLATALQIKRLDSTTVMANARVSGLDSLFFSKPSLGTGLPDSVYARALGHTQGNGILITDQSTPFAIIKTFKIDTSANVLHPLTQGMAAATYATLTQFATTLTNPMTTPGDIIQGGTSGAPGRLAGVATGNALISGGVGTANAWGKIGLTTHVSGVLPVANGGIGAATGSGYAFGNGTSPFTFSTTIPGSAISGNITGNAANITGQLAISSFNSGTGAAGNTVWFGDGTWKALPAGGTVTSVSLGNLSPLFTVSGTTLTTTPAFTFSLSNAAAHTFFGNFTGSVGAASYGTPSLTADFTSQGSTTTLLHGNASGNLSFGAVVLTTDVSGVLPVANGGIGAATGSGYAFGNGTSPFTFSTTIPGSAISGNITGNAANITGSIAESQQSFSNVTTGNVTITRHGYVPILPNNANLWLNGVGGFSAPSPGPNGFNGWQSITAGTTGTISFANVIFQFTTGQSTYTLATPSSPVDGQTFDIYSDVFNGNAIGTFVLTTTAGFSGQSSLVPSRGAQSTTGFTFTTSDHIHGQYLASGTLGPVWLINKL